MSEAKPISDHDLNSALSSLDQMRNHFMAFERAQAVIDLLRGAFQLRSEVEKQVGPLREEAERLRAEKVTLEEFVARHKEEMTNLAAAQEKAEYQGKIAKAALAKLQGEIDGLKAEKQEVEGELKELKTLLGKIRG